MTGIGRHDGAALMAPGDRVRARNGEVGEIVQVFPVLTRNISWQVDAVSVRFSSRAYAVMIAASELTVITD